MQRTQGFVALFLVLSLSLVIASFIYIFFERNTHLIQILRDTVLQESELLVTRMCTNHIESYVRAGLPSTEFMKIRYVYSVFDTEYSCTVTSAHVLVSDQIAYVVRFSVFTGNDRKHSTVTYTIQDRAITRVLEYI